jgi:hypothetical protein
VISDGDDGAQKRRDWKAAESVSDVALEDSSALTLCLDVDVVARRLRPDQVPALYLTTGSPPITHSLFQDPDTSA